MNANNDREITGVLFVLTNQVSGMRTITALCAAKFGEANSSMCNRRSKALNQTPNYPAQSKTSSSQAEVLKVPKFFTLVNVEVNCFFLFLFLTHVQTEP